MKLSYYPPAQTSNDVENLKANFEAYKDYVEARFEEMQNRINKAEGEIAALKKKKSSSRKNKSENVAPSSLSSEKLDS